MHSYLMRKRHGEGETNDKAMPRDLTDLDLRLAAVRTLVSNRSDSEPRLQTCSAQPEGAVEAEALPQSRVRLLEAFPQPRALWLDALPQLGCTLLSWEITE